MWQARSPRGARLKLAPCCLAAVLQLAAYGMMPAAVEAQLTNRIAGGNGKSCSFANFYTRVNLMDAACCIPASAANGSLGDANVQARHRTRPRLSLRGARTI